MLVETLDHCLVCGYSLHGLPDVHRCPECGTDYDRRTLVWRQKSPWRKIALYLGWQLLLTYLLIEILAAKTVAAFGSNYGPIVLGLILMLILLGTVAHRIVQHRRGMLVALTPEGIFVRRGRRMWRLPLDEIAFLSVVDTHPWIQRRDPKERISLAGCFDSKQEARAFKEAVEEAGTSRPVMR